MKKKLTQTQIEIILSLLKVNQLKMTVIIKSIAKKEDILFVERNLRTIDKLLSSLEE